MSSNATAGLASTHRERPEIGRPRMAKADLRFPEVERYRAGIAAIVHAITSHWTLEEFAARLEKGTGRPNWDVRQLARWQNGSERPQFDALMTIEELREPLLIGMAKLGDMQAEITTSITLKRFA